MNFSKWKPIFARLRFVLPAVIAVFLCYQLSQIGWRNIWGAIPTNPAYYVLFFVGYWVLPISDSILYRRSWRFPFFDGFRAFVVKRIYNQDVLDYSGELSLLMWARRRLPLSELQILRTIKDNSIVSALCGHVFALLLPAVCYVWGRSAATRPFGDAEAIGVVVGPASVVGIVLGALFLRRWIFSFSDRELAAAAAIQLTRIVLSNSLVLCQWIVVMPEQPLYVWFTLLTLANLIGRLPWNLGKDLIFVSLGVEASQQFGVPADAAAGMLLVGSVLEKVLNFTLFAACWLYDRSPQPADEPSIDAPLPPALLDNNAA